MAKHLSTLLLVSFAMLGCSHPPMQDSDSMTPWERVVDSWRQSQTGSLTAIYSSVITNKSKRVYTYQATWSPVEYRLNVNTPSSTRTMRISSSEFIEDSKWCKVTSPPREGLPNLANLLALASDPLNPFGLLSRTPDVISISGGALLYVWRFSNLGGERSIEVKVNSATLKPVSLVISDVGSSNSLLIEYDFAPITIPAPPVPKLQTPTSTWNGAVASSETVAILRNNLGKLMPSGSPSLPVDPITGGPDYWKIGYEVKSVGEWGELNSVAGLRVPPKRWGRPEGIESKTYKDPSTGKLIHEFRCRFQVDDLQVRLSGKVGEIAALSFDSDLRVGQELEPYERTRICFYAAKNSNPASLSWLEAERHSYLQLEAKSVKRDSLVMLLREWLGR